MACKFFSPKYKTHIANIKLFYYIKQNRHHFAVVCSVILMHSLRHGVLCIGVVDTLRRHGVYSLYLSNRYHFAVVCLVLIDTQYEVIM